MPFNTGSTTTAGETMKFYLKLQSDSDYKEICVTSLGEELAYNIETWYDFCGRGSSSSAPTGIDVTISAVSICFVSAVILNITLASFANFYPPFVSLFIISDVLSFTIGVSE